MVVRPRLHDWRVLFLLVFCTSCSDTQEPPDAPVVSAGHTESNPERNAYFGDLHVHTAYSFDAFVLGTLASPDDAYLFAKGGTVKHLAGFDMTLKEPLDFYAVTDHAFLMGAMLAMKDPTHPLSRHPDAKALTSVARRADRIRAFRSSVQFLRPGSPRYREIDDPPNHPDNLGGCRCDG